MDTKLTLLLLGVLPPNEHSEDVGCDTEDWAQTSSTPQFSSDGFRVSEVLSVDSSSVMSLDAMSPRGRLVTNSMSLSQTRFVLQLLPESSSSLNDKLRLHIVFSLGSPEVVGGSLERISARLLLAVEQDSVSID